MRVTDCMCHNVMWVKPETTVSDCINLMAEYKIGCVPVCNDDQNVVGMVTDRDVLLRTVCCDKDIKTTPVSDIMTTNVLCCNWDEPISTAEKIMSKNQVRRLPVIEDNKIVGILSIGDIGRNQNTNKNNFSITMENICRNGDKNWQ